MIDGTETVHPQYKDSQQCIDHRHPQFRSIGNLAVSSRAQLDRFYHGEQRFTS